MTGGCRRGKRASRKAPRAAAAAEALGDRPAAERQRQVVVVVVVGLDELGPAVLEAAGEDHRELHREVRRLAARELAEEDERVRRHLGVRPRLAHGVRVAERVAPRLLLLVLEAAALVVRAVARVLRRAPPAAALLRLVRRRAAHQLAQVLRRRRQRTEQIFLRLRQLGIKVRRARVAAPADHAAQLDGATLRVGAGHVGVAEQPPRVRVRLSADLGRRQRVALASKKTSAVGRGGVNGGAQACVVDDEALHRAWRRMERPTGCRELISNPPSIVEQLAPAARGKSSRTANDALPARSRRRPRSPLLRLVRGVVVVRNAARRREGGGVRLEHHLLRFRSRRRRTRSGWSATCSTAWRRITT